MQGSGSDGFVLNQLSGTRPLVIHAQGHHEHKPHWRPIRDRFFAEPPRRLAMPADLTIITCNNGHDAMGLLERSVAHLGLDCVVAGRGVVPWRNSVDKPRALLRAMTRIDTAYLLYVDSRDAILIGDPAPLIERFLAMSCELVFSADRMNWPPRPEFRRFEDGIAGEVPGGFRYLNGGAWLGRTAFCREFFDDVAATDPLPEAPDSEQGILKQLFPRYHPRTRLDYSCALFQNVGFVAAPIFTLL